MLFAKANLHLVIGQSLELSCVPTEGCILEPPPRTAKHTNSTPVQASSRKRRRSAKVMPVTSL